MEGFLSKITKPARVNLTSLMYSQRQSLSHFQQKPFTFITIDNLKINCVLFLNNAHEKGDSSFITNNGIYQKFQKMINKSSFEEKQNEKNKAQKMKDTLLVYNHSHGSSKFEGSHLLPLCVEHQMSMVLYDSRACGESDGDMISFGKNEKIDLIYLLLKVQIDFGFKQYLLWGRSIGCNAIINFLYEMEMNKSEYLNTITKRKQEQEDRIWKQSGRKMIKKRRVILQYPTEMFNRYFNKIINLFGKNNNVPDWNTRIFHIVIIGKNIFKIEKFIIIFKFLLFLNCYKIIF